MFWCRVRRCCFGPCAVELHVGSLVIALLGIIVNSFIFYNTLMRYLILSAQDLLKICSQIILFTPGKSWETCVDHLKLFVAFLCLLSLIEILACALLVIGVNRRKSSLFIPYLIWAALNILIRVAASILAFVICVSFFTSDSLINLFFWVFSLLVNIYFYIVVNSHVLELNEEVVDVFLDEGDKNKMCPPQLHLSR